MDAKFWELLERKVNMNKDILEQEYDEQYCRDYNNYDNWVPYDGGWLNFVTGDWEDGEYLILMDVQNGK